MNPDNNDRPWQTPLGNCQNLGATLSHLSPLTDPHRDGVLVEIMNILVQEDDQKIPKMMAYLTEVCHPSRWREKSEHLPSRSPIEFMRAIIRAMLSSMKSKDSRMNFLRRLPTTVLGYGYLEFNLTAAMAIMDLSDTSDIFVELLMATMVDEASLKGAEDRMHAFWGRTTAQVFSEILTQTFRSQADASQIVWVQEVCSKVDLHLKKTGLYGVYGFDKTPIAHLIEELSVRLMKRVDTRMRIEAINSIGPGWPSAKVNDLTPGTYFVMGKWDHTFLSRNTIYQKVDSTIVTSPGSVARVVHCPSNPDDVGTPALASIVSSESVVFPIERNLIVRLAEQLKITL